MGAEWAELAGHPILKIFLAIVLSGAIGYEREISDKPAGLRTHILIGLGSALMMMVSIHVAGAFNGGIADPARIAAQVVAGVGFLGAGTIMQARGAVVGLTTAATIWAVAGVGLAVGSGMYALAGLATGAILLVLWLLGRVEHILFGKRVQECMVLRAGTPALLFRALRQVYARTRVRVEDWDVQESQGGYSVRFCFKGNGRDRRRVRQVLRAADGVEAIEDSVPEGRRGE